MNQERFGHPELPEDNAEPRLRDRFTETVARLLAGSESKDSIEDGEKKKKRQKGASKKWRRFFRGIFGGASEEGEDSESSAEHKKSSFLPFISLEKVGEGPRATKEDTLNNEHEVYSKPPVATSIDKSHHKAEEQPTATATEKQFETIPSDRVEPGDLESGIPEKSGQQVDKDSIATRLEQEPAQKEQDQGVLYIHHDPNEANIRQSEEHIGAELPPIGGDKTYEIPNRDMRARQLAVGLTGLEYLGRKRAVRKVKRQMESQQKEAFGNNEQINQRLSHEESKRTELERQLRQQNEQNLAELQAKRSVARAEQPPEKPRQAKNKEKQPQRAETTERRKEVRQEPEIARNERQTVEKTKQSPVIAESEKRVQEKAKELEMALQRERQKTEAQIQAATEAAERHSIAEKQFERRHEIKDNISTNEPVSIGSIIQNDPVYQHSIRPLEALPTAINSSQGIFKNRLALTAEDKLFYQNAARSGFYTALVIIATLIVVSILS